MENISSYAYTIMIVALVSGVVDIFTGDGIGNGVRRYVRYAVALITVLAMLSPLLGIIGTLKELIGDISLPGETEKFDTHGEAEKIQTDAARAKLVSELKAVIYEKFGVSAEVVIILDENRYNNIVIKNVNIYTNERQSEISSYISDLFGDFAEVTVYDAE